MDPWKTFAHYFVPNKRNRYKPLFLRIETASVVAFTIVALFVLSVVMQRILVVNRSPQVAAVVVSTLIDLANSDRIQNDLPPLTASPELQAAAQMKANDMVAKGYFAHESPDGYDPWYWFTQAGYNFVYAGENLAVYFSDSTAVNTAWMNSPEHRANILNIHFTQIGIATAEGMYKGQQTTFVVQEFGTPTTAANTATEAPVVAQGSATVSATTTQSASSATLRSPKVDGATIHKQNLKVITQDANFIAVENLNSNVASTVVANVALADMTPAPNTISLFFLSLITSPENDLTIAYVIIAAIIILALLLEVGIELKRQHPHRIVLGLSLVGLMLALLFVGHAFVFGHLAIA
ncbi:MAG: CAP domain-containing protein [Candidatus Pacebacteria bacterium]|nr:CAP domain-containing protein [Candidatus Paceibacterota bacterium]